MHVPVPLLIHMTAGDDQQFIKYSVSTFGTDNHATDHINPLLMFVVNINCMILHASQFDRLHD